MIEFNSTDLEFIIRTTFIIGFSVGGLMYVVPWFIGYCVQTILSIFKQITK